jgi:hypothetical protein
VVRVQAGSSHMDHTIQRTAGRTIFRPVRAGRLVLEKGNATLELKPVSITGKELMVAHRIWLKRINATRN